MNTPTSSMQNVSGNAEYITQLSTRLNRYRSTSLYKKLVNRYQLVFKFFIGGFYSGHFELALKKEHLNCFISDFPLKPEEPTNTFRIVDDPDWQILLLHLKTLKWKLQFMSLVYAMALNGL